MPKLPKSNVTGIGLSLAIIGVIFFVFAVWSTLREKPGRAVQPPSAARADTAAPDTGPQPEVADVADETGADTTDVTGTETLPEEKVLSEVDKLVDKAERYAQSDLDPARVAKAEEILVRERDMWAQFAGFSANVDINMLIPESEDDIRLNAVISMGPPKIILNKNPRGGPKWECAMTVNDRDGKWSFTAESRTEYKLVCDDPKLAEKLEPLLAEIVPDIVLTPRALLLFLDTGDKAGGPAGVPREEYFKVFSAYAHPELASADDCFLFRSTRSDEVSLIFEQGHVAGFRKGPYGNELRKLSYGSYSQLPENGFWFPTRMSWQYGSGAVQVTLGFSDVKPN